MDPFAGLVLVTLGAAFAALVVSPRTARSLDTFAAGFLPYRSAGWPQGVQEEDPVPWSWSTTRGRHASTDVAGQTLDRAETVEISGDTSLAEVVELQPVRHPITSSNSTRPLIS